MPYAKEKEAQLLELAEQLKKDGLRCFVVPVERGYMTYMTVGDDTGVAYIQCGDFGGYEVSTEHKPCTGCGTGFRLTEQSVSEVSTDFVRLAINKIAPSWAIQSDTKEVEKYASVDEWLSKQNILNWKEI